MCTLRELSLRSLFASTDSLKQHVTKQAGFPVVHKGISPVHHVISCSFTNMVFARENAFLLQSLILFAFLIRNCSLNLVVNVKAIDGEIVQQNFFADPEKDYVTIDFKNNQGRFVTVHIDFRLVSFSFTLPWLFKL